MTLLKRDTCCGVAAKHGFGLHIIPYERGSDVRSTIFWGYLIVTLSSPILEVTAYCPESSKLRRAGGGPR
jgi:hypothetical protein